MSDKLFVLIISIIFVSCNSNRNKEIQDFLNDGNEIIIENFTSSNEYIFTEFEVDYAENPKRVGKYKEIVDSISIIYDKYIEFRNKNISLLNNKKLSQENNSDCKSLIEKASEIKTLLLFHTEGSKTIKNEVEQILDFENYNNQELNSEDIYNLDIRILHILKLKKFDWNLIFLFLMSYPKIIG